VSKISNRYQQGENVVREGSEGGREEGRKGGRVCLYVLPPPSAFFPGCGPEYRWRHAMTTGRIPKRKGSPKPPLVSMAPKKPSEGGGREGGWVGARYVEWSPS